MTQFRSEMSSTQTITSGVTATLTYGSTKFDTDSVMSTNTFIVPSSWNGKFGILYGGHHTTGSETASFGWWRSTNGGSTYQYIALCRVALGNAGNITTGPLLMVTGHRYQLRFSSGAATMSATERNHVSGRLLGQPRTLSKKFYATASSTQSVGATVVTPLTRFASPVYDPDGLLSGSVFTVPASLNGGYASLYGGWTSSAPEFNWAYLQKSTNGGSSYDILSGKQGKDSEGAQVTSGVIPLTTGHKYRLMAYSTTGGATAESGQLTFFSGDLWIPF